MDIDDVGDLRGQFPMVFGFHDAEKKFTLRPDAVIYNNEIFDRLRALKRSVADVVADETDYRGQLRSAATDEARNEAVSMISVQRLAKSAQHNLDDAFGALFK